MSGSPAFVPTIGAALERARREMQSSQASPLEAQALLAFLLCRPRESILAHPEAELPPDLYAEYLALIQRVIAGEPLAYLTGTREFFGLDFFVSPEVLIPRPETELLVETALEWISAQGKRIAPTDPPARVVDLGTGCGCIAAALAVNVPELTVTATDISSNALSLAARNFAALGVSDRILAVQSDLLNAVRGPVDLLCANLPYIPEATLKTLPVIRYEPRIALDGGPDGLRLIERALEQAARLLSAGGLALFEIEATQGEAAQKMARRFFPAAAITVKKDFAGKDRLLFILR